MEIKFGTITVTLEVTEQRGFSRPTWSTNVSWFEGAENFRHYLFSDMRFFESELEAQKHLDWVADSGSIEHFCGNLERLADRARVAGYLRGLDEGCDEGYACALADRKDGIEPMLTGNDPLSRRVEELRAKRAELQAKRAGQ